MYKEGCKVLRSNVKVSANANYLGEPREVNHVIDATRVRLRQEGHLSQLNALLQCPRLPVMVHCL